MREPLYRIEFEYTTGSSLISESAHSLTREECDRLLKKMAAIILNKRNRLISSTIYFPKGTIFHESTT